MSSGRRSSQRKGANSESNRSSSSDLSSQLRDQNQKNFDTLKEGADAVANESEAKLIQMFEEHLKQTEELCLRFRTNGSSITDTDVKLLGPRLKSISDAFLKTTQETDMHIKQVEDLFDSKIREMKKNFEEGIRRERKNCEAVVARLEKEVQSERERGEGNLKEVVAQHKEVIEVRYCEAAPKALATFHISRSNDH
jgi:cell division protein ZapA (FtsZ GTPase activity inhibitor)